MKRAILFLALLLVYVFAGCNQQTSAPVQSSKSPDTLQQVAIEKQLRSQLPDVPELSPGAGDRWPSNPNLDLYAVTFIWGTFAPGPTATPLATDWSGNLRMGPAGQVNLTAKISFEPGQDTVYGSDNPLQSTWKSLTINDVDGLSFLVAIDKSSPLTVMPYLLFTTTPVELNLSMGRLDRFDTLIFADAQNALLVVSRKLKNSLCPRGAITGLWTKTDVGGASGKFDGKWLASNTIQSGYLSGNFWTENAGGRLFFGQYTDLNHKTVGYVRGNWFYDDPRMCPMCGSSRGVFTGVFTGLDSVAIGGIEGEFGDLSLPLTLLDLPFKGTWKLWCPKPEAESSQQ